MRRPTGRDNSRGTARVLTVASGGDDGPALTDEGGAAALWLLERAAALAAEEEAGDAAADELRALADDAYARCWERLHGGSWQDVAPVWREAFGRASLLKVGCHALDAACKSEFSLTATVQAWSLGTRGELVECIKMLDMVSARAWSLCMEPPSGLGLTDPMRSSA